MDVIYYFTGTGNSIAVAKAMAEHIPDLKLDRIVKAKENGHDATAYSRIGIVFPVYFSGIPFMVRHFIRNLKMKEDTYVYAVSNYGDLSDIAEDQFRSDLARNRHVPGMEVAGFFGIRMPGNYQLLYDLDAPQKIQADRSALPIEAGRIASLVLESKNMDRRRSSIPTKIKGNLIYGIFKPYASDTKFKVTDRCTSCKLCTRVCPAENIAMDEDSGRPVWKHRCEQCLACFHLCPIKAIHTGGKTLERGRYKHQDISLKELMIDG